MDKEVKKIVDFLNLNISLEHGAIIQYLFHAYTIGDEDIEGKLEEIAREEMRHLKMFAHTVVDLGGIPSIDERSEVYLEAPDIPSLLQFDIDAEKMAIEEYEKQLKEISDRKIQRILERAIVDEEAHLEIFKDLKEKVKETFNKKDPKINQKEKEILLTLNNVLKKQYRKILETLYQSFISRHSNPFLSVELEERAVDKMKHFGWISEEISERGGTPDFSMPSVEKVSKIEDIVSFQEEDEKETSTLFKELSSKVEDNELKWVLERISKREIHYRDFGEFIKKANISGLTVGSLFKKKK
jgi:bacterioferritin